ncbi:MAG: hypothetical protein JNM24_11230 [Bdellovibrionaceae bacterium]|nr:hypothetical protein [Pseudobdellovibrionaceae bacterium]
MIRYLLAAFFIVSGVSYGESGVWTLTTPNYKQVKVNGVALKNAAFWDLPQMSQVQTANTDALVFLPEHVYLKIFKNSHIRWDGNTLHVVSGGVYVKAVSSSVAIQVPILFKFGMNPGDMTIDHDPKAKSVRFEVLSKAQPIQIDSDDRVLTTTEGTKLAFQAEFVEGEMAYDFLLNDRKIPKLRMEKGQIEKPIILDATIWTAQVKKAVADKAKHVKKVAGDNSKYICKNPNGVLNSCFFVREGSSCLRYTCNLSGEWTQKTTFSDNNLCPKAKIVKDCEWLGR